MPHSLPGGVVQDPETGRFVSASEIGFNDYELIPFSLNVHADGHTSGNSAIDWKNTTEFEGFEFFDVSDMLDRHRIGHLVNVQLGLGVAGYHTGGAGEWAAGASVEISSSPSLKAAQIGVSTDLIGVSDTTQSTGDMDDITANTKLDDTLDLVSRPLAAFSGGLFGDDVDGPGGNMSGGHDRVQGPPRAPMSFDRRDELYLNGTIAHNGIFAGSIWVQVSGLLVFGLTES